ncbi:MAG: ribosome maturation factor RimM [Tannerella sp.]|jgi:16S rRNA processing protein RimM|nr:ribosome maturation factor RimM [Tannerella sp.]
MIRKEDLFPIGHFTKPHGLQGELPLLTSHADILEQMTYIVCEMEGIPVPFFIESYRPKGRLAILLKLEHVDDPETAKRFTNREVYCPRKRVKNVPGEMVNWQQLVNYMIEDETLGELGRIVHVNDSTLNVFLHIDRQGKELLAPIAPDLIRAVDVTSGRIVVALPEGLLEFIAYNM